MLKELTIEQFVIIDKLKLVFQPGLTIVTGETGAGKSIILGAMGLILGEPDKPDAIRQGSRESTIEAVVTLPPGSHAVQFLTDNKLAEGTPDEIVIRRVVHEKEENSSILINDKPVDRELLSELGTHLMEIHGQFANQSLTDPANQLKLLDLSGGFPPEIFKNVADALAEVHRCTKALADEKAFLARYKDKIKRIAEVVKTLDELGMNETFVAEIQAEYNELLTAKESSEAFQAILSQFIAGNGIIGSLTFANHTLGRQNNLDEEKVAHLKENLALSLESARTAVNEIRRLAPLYEIDTSSLQELERILGILHKISAETGTEVEDMNKFHKDITAILERYNNGRAKLSELEKDLHDAKVNYRHHAHVLSEKRTAAAGALSKAVTAEFAPLKLANADFDVVVVENPELPWTELGLDEVTFTGRMNPGMPFSPIANTASGGELARMMLALKVVVQEVQTTPSLVFDEVDTGIGGSAASAVGERLAQLSGAAQVFVITHSPQVASRGDQHLHVTKATDGITTASVVTSLSPDERLEEISRMLSGSETTEESRAAARALLEEAANAAQRRKQAAEAAKQEPAPVPEQVPEPVSPEPATESEPEGSLTEEVYETAPDTEPAAQARSDDLSDGPESEENEQEEEGELEQETETSFSHEPEQEPEPEQVAASPKSTD